MKNNLTIKKPSMVSMKGLLALFLCAFVFASCDRINEQLDEVVDEVEEREVKMFEAYLTPLNNSGVTGKATIKYSVNGKFEVWINAKGLTPNRMHPQHIHGFVMDHKKSTCPPPSVAGEDGLISHDEVEHHVGDELIPLDDKLVPLSGDNYPFLGHGAGELTYYESVATKELLQAFDNMHDGKQTEADLRLMDRVLVLHGAFIKDGKVQQHYNEGAEYHMELPVACGEIMKK